MNADVLSSIEQAVDLGVYSGHDHCVEQCDQSCKEQSADYNGDDDLDSSINVMQSSLSLREIVPLQPALKIHTTILRCLYHGLFT